ncbi:MAG TPA: hypothetical protein DCY88_24900 [Cyanobacteria bacterium UBA11372]|nr:hypothetical protein [Cyanobacteria bacterium UBA11372]
MQNDSYWQKVGELLRGATETAEQLAIAERSYQSLLEALNRINFIQLAKETDKPPSDRHTEQTVSAYQELNTQAIKLASEIEKHRLIIEKLTADVQKLQEPIGEIESIKRQIQVLSYSQGLSLKKDPPPDSNAIKPGDVIVSGDRPVTSKLLGAFNTMSLPPVKYKIVNYLRVKKEVFYPAEVARELDLHVSYVARIFRDLESDGFLVSIDTNGYRGRKLYKVVEPL